jgi:hypothetical protein
VLRSVCLKYQKIVSKLEAYLYLRTINRYVWNWSTLVYFMANPTAICLFSVCQCTLLIIFFLCIYTYIFWPNELETKLTDMVKQDNIHELSAEANSRLFVMAISLILSPIIIHLGFVYPMVNSNCYWSFLLGWWVSALYSVIFVLVSLFSCILDFFVVPSLSSWRFSYNIQRHIFLVCLRKNSLSTRRLCILFSLVVYGNQVW